MNWEELKSGSGTNRRIHAGSGNGSGSGKRRRILRQALPGIVISLSLVLGFTVLSPFLIGYAIGTAGSIILMMLLAWLIVSILIKLFYRKLSIRKAMKAGGKTALFIGAVSIISQLLTLLLGTLWGWLATIAIIIIWFFYKKRNVYAEAMREGERAIFGKPLKDYPKGHYPKIKIVRRKE